MKPKTAIELQNREAVIIAVPNVEGGHFTQEMGLDKKKYLGEIALVSGIPASEVFDSSHDPLESYHQAGPEPGSIEMINGAHVTLLIGSKATHELSDNVIADAVQYSTTSINEYQPFID
jgi:hypothetical protein